MSSVVCADILKDLVRVEAILLYNGELPPNSCSINTSEERVEGYGIWAISDGYRRNQAMLCQIKNYQHRVARADAEEPPVRRIDRHSRRSFARL